MKKKVITLFEKCVACKSCEIACAIEHSASGTLFGALLEIPRSKPRVYVQNAGNYSYPSKCMHCEEASCMQACPTGAMQRNSASDAVFVDGDRCIGCWMCMMVCPFGAITTDPEAKKSHKCDLCPDRVLNDREPACVEACPTSALLFASPDLYSTDKRHELARNTVAGEMKESHIPAHMELFRTLKGVAP